MPIATVIFSLINFFVVFVMSVITNIYYYFTGENIRFGWYLLLVPILVVQTAALGLGFGIIVSSLTTKYRDLVILVNFGVQLWMYATPVVYDLEMLPERFQKIVMLNPMSPVMCNFRYAMMGCGRLETHYWGISMVTTVVVLMIGILLFNRVEKTFMDTV
jgi:lipopolysaccharide transport system permease protein